MFLESCYRSNIKRIFWGWMKEIILKHLSTIKHDVLFELLSVCFNSFCVCVTYISVYVFQLVSDVTLTWWLCQTHSFRSSCWTRLWPTRSWSICVCWTSIRSQSQRATPASSAPLVCLTEHSCAHLNVCLSLMWCHFQVPPPDRSQSCRRWSKLEWTSLGWTSLMDLMRCVCSVPCTQHRLFNNGLQMRWTP